MAEELIYLDGVITKDGVALDPSSLSEKVNEQIANLKFVDERIVQKSNELQIADSARIMYASVLRREGAAKAG